MRMFDLPRLSVLLIVGMASPALALDAKRQTPPASAVGSAAAATAAAAITALTPVQAFRSGTELLRSGGDKEKALDALRYSAEQGYALAQWKLGRMYKDGDGVQRDEITAFRYFSRMASDHAEAAPWTQQARFVANAYVSLGAYYLNGIPNSPVRADPVRAYRLLSYAASYFGDPDAQYQLARLYLEGRGAPHDVRAGVRWLNLAAPKGQYQAQAQLGHILFRGEGVPRDRARGLMWLTLGRDAAAGPEDGWIVEAYEDAFEHAIEDERARAYVYLQRWLRQQR